jgi:prefoldin subunit 5
MGVHLDKQVSNTENEELLEAFNELFLKFKELNSSYKLLKSENELLHENLGSLNNSEINKLKEINHELFSENSSLTNTNRHLKKECDLFKVRISDLDKNITSIKSKYETISHNVGKFNKGKEDLNNLLSIQKIPNNRHGLGYTPKVKPKPNNISHNESKNNHAFIYTKFVKSKHDNSFPNIIKLNNYVKPTNTLRDINKHKLNHIKSNFIWVPKNSVLFDRQQYINEYIKNICNSEHYLCRNEGKPNTYWVWFPKN